ncbi:oxidoreductase-like protein [Halenospora varia]|nr:oxidoreductase-like protein [Halenospora varia]
MAFYEAETQWHTGEEQMHKLLRVPQRDNPTKPYLTPNAAQTLMRSPLVALGALDSEGRPWTTILGGEAGFSQPIAQGIIGMKTTVDMVHDPVVETLLGEAKDGSVIQVKELGKGKMVSGLAIDLETRRRVKLFGRMIAGAVSGTEEGIGEAQVVVKIEQSLGNCPKYLNKKHIIPHIPKPHLESSTLPLSTKAVDLISQSDLFFISSSNHDRDMDTNHRGGPPGFVRVLSNSPVEGVTLVYPEYSGNRFYQTLGNLLSTPQAGLAFLNFENGDILYVTGKTEVLAGEAARNLIGHTNLAVKIHVEAARYVSNALSFRGQLGERSPYNPPVWYLNSEKSLSLPSDKSQITTTLLSKTVLTPTIARFKFHISDPKKASTWKPGQYVALSFADELDIGYSHMRDDDPKSLNDDFLRTFTVSSRQDEKENHDQFEITIRKVGVVTDFMFRANPRAGLEVGLSGFGGEFFVEQKEGEKVGFVAGGVGITPLLAQAEDLDVENLSLYWTGWKKLQASGAKVEKRRLKKEDFEMEDAKKWYLCTGTAFRNQLLEWLGGKETFYEDFNY